MTLSHNSGYLIQENLVGDMRHLTEHRVPRVRPPLADA
jgi:hypothetical protein